MRLSRKLPILLACSALMLSAIGCVAPPPNVLRPDPMRPDAVPVARELDKTTLPTYTIEPPDVLTIETQRIVPRSPYKFARWTHCKSRSKERCPTNRSTASSSSNRAA
ncbi:MAG: hypothetical protein QM811_24550 [Pirellulales bacterium]